MTNIYCTTETNSDIIFTSDEMIVESFTAQGPAGPKGDKGDQGDVGPGVAIGGDIGQVLVKNSEIDYDTKWIDLDLVNITGTLDGGTF